MCKKNMRVEEQGSREGRRSSTTANKGFRIKVSNVVLRFVLSYIHNIFFQIVGWRRERVLKTISKMFRCNNKANKLPYMTIY